MNLWYTIFLSPSPSPLSLLGMRQYKSRAISSSTNEHLRIESPRSAKQKRYIANKGGRHLRKFNFQQNEHSTVLHLFHLFKCGFDRQG